MAISTQTLATAPLSLVDTGSHLRAVLAIARKDWLHFYRYPLEAIFRVVEPVMWLTPIYFLGQSFSTAQGNTGFAGFTGTADFMSFILIGWFMTSYISAVFWGMGFSLKREMDSGVLETNWMTPLPRLYFLVGQTLASLAITTVDAVGTLILAWFVFGFRVNGNVLSALSAILPMLIGLYGFGFAFAAVVLLMREANALVDISNYVVSMLSGAQFPVQVLPRFLMFVSLALPLTYGFDALRGFLLNTRTLLPIELEIGILIVFMAVMVVAGWWVFQRVERRCRVLGTLSMH